MNRNTASYQLRPAFRSTDGSARIPQTVTILGADPSANDAKIDRPLGPGGALIEIAANEEVYGIDEPAHRIYKVVFGAVRTCKILVDGRRYIDSFYLQGDIFGFENRAKHELTCEAVCQTKLQIVSQGRSSPMTLEDDDIDLLKFMAEEMRRAQAQGSMLVQTASERVVGFLLQIAAHCSGPGAFQLPMSRQDIADHLGLTIETVSRVLSQLEDSQIILRTPRRHILVRNRKALEQMSS